MGLLKALAEREGWSATAFHLNLDFAALIGRPHYETLCQHRGMQLSDWIFSLAAFGARAPDPSGALVDTLPEEYIESLSEHGIQDVGAWLMRLRAQLAFAFIESARIALEDGDFDVIGFTSTFQQNVASFALARALKSVACDSTILFGGANFDDTMGIEFVRSLCDIDYAAIGEGDECFPEFLRAIADGSDPGAVHGIASRVEDDSVRFVPRSHPFEALDDLPIPDYSEYFERAERLGFFGDDPRRNVDLPIEGARGCWWGQKHHCIFCGLNAGTMKFRAKSPERVVEEIVALSSRHHSFHIEFVDNIIDMGFFDTVLPQIRNLQASWNIFFEVKSNLRAAQVSALAAAGVRRIQPGIESLSSVILKIMRKGVTAAQNVNLLRWCVHYGISVSWNLLWGFPREEEAHYHEQSALISHIVHLQPPDGQGRLWMERFSPLFTQPSAFGVTGVRPAESYRHVYPDEIDLNKAAYFFDYEIDGTLPEAFFETLVGQLDDWRARWRSETPPTLRFLRAPGYTRIEDNRGLGSNGIYELEGSLAAIYAAFFDRPVGIVQQAAGLGLARDEVEDAVEGFVSRGLMMRDGDVALSLAVPAVA